jgi:proteasome lid subunit RPN8/RPN11
MMPITNSPFLNHNTRASPRTERTPVLRFSPLAWAQLLFLRDCGPTEVGGFGVTAEDDLLRVEEIQLVRQQCSSMSVVYDDESVADFFDRQVDRGLAMERVGRVWVHTHPGNCPAPSLTDEVTFDRVFGRSQWAVMFILARGGQCYARLRFSVGPGGDIVLPVTIDYSRPFPASDEAAWHAEYRNQVERLPLAVDRSFGQPWESFEDVDGFWPRQLVGEREDYPF